MPAAAIVSKAISSANLFTDESRFNYGYFNISIWGTFAATITLQRSFDDGDTWLDVDTFDEAAEKIVANAEGDCLWRIGVKSGQYTSGTAHVRLGQGQTG